MKFIGWDYDTLVPLSHRIFNDAIVSGYEITQTEFESGEVKVR